MKKLKKKARERDRERILNKRVKENWRESI